jgi:hypothetical protein
LSLRGGEVSVVLAMHTVNEKVGDEAVHLRGCAVVCDVSLRVYCERFKLLRFVCKSSAHEAEADQNGSDPE